MIRPIETRQHSIPQFYQRRFIADGSGLIWVYQKGEEPRQKSIRKTAMEVNFYAFTNNDRTDTQSVTCDNPVVFNKGTGLKDRNAVVIFPLSRKLLLQAMWTSNYRASVVQLADAQIRTMNRYVVQNALSEVCSSKRSKVFQAFVSKWIGSFNRKTPKDSDS